MNSSIDIDKRNLFLGYYYGVGELISKGFRSQPGMYFINGETNSIWVWDALERRWIDTNRVDSGLKGMLTDREGNAPADYRPSQERGVKEAYFYVAECEPESTKTITFVYFKNGADSLVVEIDNTSIISLYWNGDYWETSVVPMNVDLSKYAKSADVNAETNRATQAETNLQSVILREENRATQAENNISSALQSETDRATQAEQNLSSNIENETLNRGEVINSLKSKVNQNVFCTTEEGNDIFKEVYFYPYVETRDVESITITKKDTKYQITFKDSEGRYSYVYLGNSSAVLNGEVVSGVVGGTGFASGATMYAVIDWYKVVDDKPILTNFTHLIGNSKYSPIITHVMQSYKFVKGSLGNAFIRELYLKDLRREEYVDGKLTLTHDYKYTLSAIPKTFTLSNVSRNVNGKWVINFGASYDGKAYPFKFETSVNPENDTVIKSDLLCWIEDGSVQYKATMYAVVDWSQIPDGTGVNYGRPLLAGVVQQKLSPIISNLSSTKIQWDELSNLNTITQSGEYEIVGSREQSWQDNMPIISGGELHARLSVFANGGYISQFIRFDNIGGGDCNLYTRVCQNGAWESWQKLQTNIEVNAIGVGQSKTFNDLTDNGIYSGVNVYWIDPANYLTSYETFVLVVINAYLTGGGVSQLKYSTLVDGTTSVMTRTLINGTWSEWKSVGGSDSESILISGAGTFSIDGDKYKTVFLTSVGPGTGYYNITATKSTTIDVVLLDIAANYLHFDVNGTGRYVATKSYQAGMYRLAIDMTSKTMMIATISNDTVTKNF